MLLLLTQMSPDLRVPRLPQGWFNWLFQKHPKSTTSQCFLFSSLLSLPDMQCDGGLPLEHGFQVIFIFARERIPFVLQLWPIVVHFRRRHLLRFLLTSFTQLKRPWKGPREECQQKVSNENIYQEQSTIISIIVSLISSVQIKDLYTGTPSMGNQWAHAGTGHLKRNCSRQLTPNSRRTNGIWMILFGTSLDALSLWTEIGQNRRTTAWSYIRKSRQLITCRRIPANYCNLFNWHVTVKYFKRPIKVGLMKNNKSERTLSFYSTKTSF